MQLTQEEKDSLKVVDKKTGKDMLYMSHDSLKEKYNEIGHESMRKLIKDSIIHTSYEGRQFINLLMK